MARPDIDTCFERLRQLCEWDQWEVQEQNEDGIVASRIGGPASNACTVRLTHEVHAEYEAKVARMRPEFFASVDMDVLTCSVLEVVAPGDAILLVRMHDLQADSAVRLLGGKVQSSDNCRKARISLRRDFPQPGKCCVIAMPLLNDRVATDLHKMPRWIHAKMVDAADGRLMKIHSYFEVPWPSFPEWSVPYFRNMLAFEKKVDNNCPPEMYKLAEEYYVVLTLRSCTRGPPLLPGHISGCAALQKDANSVVMGDFQWSRLAYRSFDFAAYLGHFLTTAGFAAPVYNSLDGRRLVGYQAVLSSQDWRSCQPHFEALFSAQQTAYRLLNGGRSAPKIRDNVAPRFLAYSGYDMAFGDEVLFTRNTFLELRSMSALKTHVAIRAAECPPVTEPAARCRQLGSSAA